MKNQKKHTGIMNKGITQTMEEGERIVKSLIELSKTCSASNPIHICSPYGSLRITEKLVFRLDILTPEEEKIDAAQTGRS